MTLAGLFNLSLLLTFFAGEKAESYFPGHLRCTGFCEVLEGPETEGCYVVAQIACG